MPTIADEERGIKGSPKSNPSQDGYGSISKAVNYQETNNVSHMYYDGVVSSMQEMRKKIVNDFPQSKRKFFKISVLLLVLGLTAYVMTGPPSSDHAHEPMEEILASEVVPNPGNYSLDLSAIDDDDSVITIQSVKKCYKSEDVTAEYDVGCDLAHPHCLTELKEFMGYCVECIYDDQCSTIYEVCHDYTYTCIKRSSQEPYGLSTQQHGYDMYNGNPYGVRDSSGKMDDPGLKTYQLFDHRWLRDGSPKYIRHVKFHIPDGYQIVSDDTCLLTTTSEIITNSEEYEYATKSALNLQVSGTIKGVNVGGGLNTASYKQVYDAVKMKRKTVTSQSLCERYEFEMAEKLNDGTNHTLALISNVRNILKALPPGYSTQWYDFFSTYGTHIVTAGTVGAFRRYSSSFNSVQIERIVQGKETFEASFNMGMPEVFDGKASYGDTDSSNSAQAIKKNSGDSEVYNKGSIEDWTNSVIVRKTLSPVCDWLDYSDIQNFNKDDCLKNTEQYCIQILRGLYGKKVNTCQVPADKMFECVYDSDCPGDKRCWNDECVTPSTGSGCHNLVVTGVKYTGCGYGRKCPSGWNFDFGKSSCGSLGCNPTTDNKNCLLKSQNYKCVRNFDYAYSCQNGPYKGKLNHYPDIGGLIGCVYNAPERDGDFAKVQIYSQNGIPSDEECRRILTQDPK